MGRVIDRKIDKEITQGLNVNKVINSSTNRYILPAFEKNNKGEYIFVGNSEVTNLSEYKEYIQRYSEIGDFIKGKYSHTISRIYRNALNTLITINDKYYLSRNKYSPSSKFASSFTIGNIATENTADYENLLSYITRAAFNVKQLKPSYDVLDILNNSQKDFAAEEVVYVLPQIGDNGVVLYPKKGDNNFVEAQYELISQLDAVAIENFMFETASSLDKETARQVKSHIAKIFDLSKNIGNKIMIGSNDGVVNELADLTRSLIELVGADLSAFEKAAFADNQPKNDVQEKELTTENQEVDSRGYEFTADEILIRGSFKTSPAVVGDVIVTRLTPEGVKFDVTFDSDKLFVQSTSENSSSAKEM